MIRRVLLAVSLFVVLSVPVVFFSCHTGEGDRLPDPVDDGAPVVIPAPAPLSEADLLRFRREYRRKVAAD